MVVLCKKCTKRISITKKGVNCSDCGDSYHFVCGKISDEVSKEIERGATDWRCTNCRTSNQRRSFINVGLERSNSVSSDAAVDRNSSSLDSTFTELAIEIRKLSAAQESCLQSLKTMDKKMEELKTLSLNVKQHDKRIESLEKDNKTLKSLVKNMAMQIEDGDQKANSKKIVLNGVPFSPGEDLNKIIKSTMAKINVEINDGEICDTYRMFARKPIHNIIGGPNLANNSSSDTPATNVQNTITVPDQPTTSSNTNKESKAADNPIIIEVSCLKKRNQILKSFKQIKNVHIDGNRKIYIHEFLISNRRRLLQKAKLFARTNNFKYVWTRDGKIFMRRADGEKIIRVNAFTDFAGLCDMESEIISE